MRFWRAPTKYRTDKDDAGPERKRLTASTELSSRRQRLSGFHSRRYKFPFLASSNKCSEALQDSARIVSVGFLSGLVTKAAASVTKRFLTSWAWQYLFNAEVFGSLPIRTVPDSWICTPPS